MRPAPPSMQNKTEPKKDQIKTKTRNNERQKQEEAKTYGDGLMISLSLRKCGNMIPLLTCLGINHFRKRKVLLYIICIHYLILPHPA